MKLRRIKGKWSLGWGRMGGWGTIFEFSIPWTPTYKAIYLQVLTHGLVLFWSNPEGELARRSRGCPRSSTGGK